MVPVLMIISDPWPEFQGHSNLHNHMSQKRCTN